ncbi:hypothetical protein BX666DRAFT_1905925 [Dichotomocladium elegans]|nr:hypothetical protein BX666DRAFT_1905925 [Dichotomocladium elegans]
MIAASGLQVELCEDMKRFGSVTHLVTRKDDMGLSPRTEKYLRGILGGVWIVDRSCKQKA